MCDYKIPEVIPLDYNFGYLIGAYAAEGCMTRFQVSISNNDIEYLKPIFESTGAGWADRELVTYTYKLVETKIRVVRLTGGPWWSSWTAWTSREFYNCFAFRNRIKI